MRTGQKNLFYSAHPICCIYSFTVFCHLYTKKRLDSFAVLRLKYVIEFCFPSIFLQQINSERWSALMSDFGGARWICSAESTVSPVFYKEFICDEPWSATLYITGLGFFEAAINGYPISEDRFVPVLSDYEPRDLTSFKYPLNDHTAHRIYYCRYDVTSLISSGKNLLTVQLGNGYYRQKERNCEGPVDFGTTLKTIFRMIIHCADKTIEVISDGSELWKASEITYSNLFIGEVIDPRSARRQTFQPVYVAEAPEAELTLQTCPADRLERTISPTLLHCCGNRSVYDAGENISGIVRFYSHSPAGSHITLRFSENIRSDFSLDFSSTGSNHICSSGRRQIMEDLFITDGSDRCYEPKFVWHAFRYFEVEGEIDSPTVLVIHTDASVTSTFDSSSEGLNFLYNAFLRTQTNNMHAGIPMDCPHRERLGYTGDGQACAPATMLLMDSEAFYRKWIQDILDCQDAESGHVQHTAPLMGGGGGPGGWGCAIVLVPWYFYQRYGDKELLQKCFSPMQRWINYLLFHCEDGLVVREEERGWCLGDWCTLESTQIPEPFVNTCYLLKCLQILQEISEILHQPQWKQHYLELAGTTASSLRRHYEADGEWCHSVQGSQAWALWVVLAADQSAESLAARYNSLGCFDTGFLGTDILTEVLLQRGFTDTAFSLLDGDKPGSFLYMKHNGATTLWERWTGQESHNHPMFGACVRHLFTYFLGIRQEGVGYNQILIAPQIPHSLYWAEGSLLLREGRLAVRWEQHDKAIRFSLSIPEGQSIRFVFGGTDQRLSSGEHTLLCPFEKQIIS